MNIDKSFAKFVQFTSGFILNLKNEFCEMYVSVNEKFEAVEFLQDHYLLFRTQNCSHCSTEMTLYLGEKEHRFRCNNRKCKKRPQKQKRWGTFRSIVDSYLSEFMWRQQTEEKTGLFEEILNGIVKNNPLC